MAKIVLPYTRLMGVSATSNGKRTAGFFVRTSDVSEELREWTSVNPRVVNQSNFVWKAIRNTLVNEPEHFGERNRGFTLVVDAITVNEKNKQVTITLEDRKLHGMVDGGHTLDAILTINKNGPAPKGEAEVFFKVMLGVTRDQIAEIAGGLNRSEQVDTKSLENLRNHFGFLQKTLKGQPYEDLIAYRMNEPKPIDVREILYYLAVFDCEEYNEDRHPVQLFGRKEGIIRKFAEQHEAGATSSSFAILTTKAPEILWLRDEIERRVITKIENIGYYKTGKKTKIGSFRGNRLMFQNEEINGKVPLGWIMPMLGAFRSNVVWDKPKGSFSWKLPLPKLLDATLMKLVSAVQEIHTRENSRPEYVGRSSFAWKMCYQIVEKEVLKSRLKEAEPVAT